MPTNSAWGTDPDEPVSFADYVSPDEPLPDLTPEPAKAHTAQVVPRDAFDSALDSMLDSDWMGDEEWDEAGNLITDRPRTGTPLRFQIGRNKKLQKAYDRRRKVVEMKMNGHTFEDIAIALGFNSIEGARASFNRAMQDTRDVAEEWRDVVLARYERMIGVLMPMADTGDIEAIDKIVKIQVQIAKVTRMETVQAIGHGAGERGETVKDVVERIGMVEDVNAFLDALPGLVSMSPQPSAKIVDDQGNEVHIIHTETEQTHERESA